MNRLEYLKNIGNSNGFFRPNTFEVIVTGPESLEVENESLRRISANCRISGLPGRTFETKPHDQGGQIERMFAHSVQFNEMTLTFNLSQDQVEKRFFDAWQDIIIKPDGQLLAYYEEYASGTVQINVLDKNDKVYGQYELVDAWPRSVTDVELSMDSNDQIAQLSVAMNFHHYKFTS